MKPAAPADPEGVLSRRPRARGAALYDFRRPNRFSREQMRSLHICGDTFARQLSTVLASTLGGVASAALEQVEQSTYDEYMAGLPNPSDLMVLTFSGLGGFGIFDVDLVVSLAAVDRMLGGVGRPLEELRALSAIELGLTSELYTRGLHELDYAFESLGPVGASIARQESNPQFSQIGAPSDMMVIFTLSLRVIDTTGRATLCVPCSSFQPLLDTTDESANRTGRQRAEAEAFARALARTVGRVPVPVTAAFRSASLRPSEIVGLSPGDIVPLHHPVKAPLVVSVGGIPQLHAVTGRNGTRLACLIVDTPEENTP